MFGWLPPVPIALNNVSLACLSLSGSIFTLTQTSDQAQGLVLRVVKLQDRLKLSCTTCTRTGAGGRGRWSWEGCAVEHNHVAYLTEKYDAFP